MNKRIVYLCDNGQIAVITPDENCGLPLSQIASKDVPNGKSYKIIDADELPSREYRFAWRIDEEELTGGVGGPEGVQ